MGYDSIQDVINVNSEMKERVEKWSKYNGRFISKCTVDEEGYANGVNNIKNVDTGTMATDVVTRGTGQTVTFADIGSAYPIMTDDGNKSYAESLRTNLGTAVINNVNEMANETLIK